MHPPPLLRMAQYETLEHRVVSTRVATDLLIVVVALDRCQRFLEAQHVMSIAFAPGRCRYHRGAGGACDDREAAEGAGGMAEELDLDAVAPRGVLVEREHDEVAGLQPFDEQIKRPLLGQGTEAEAARPPVHD